MSDNILNVMTSRRPTRPIKMGCIRTTETKTISGLSPRAQQTANIDPTEAEAIGTPTTLDMLLECDDFDTVRLQQEIEELSTWVNDTLVSHPSTTNRPKKEPSSATTKKTKTIKNTAIKRKSQITPPVPTRTFDELPSPIRRVSVRLRQLDATQLVIPKRRHPRTVISPVYQKYRGPPPLVSISPTAPDQERANIDIVNTGDAPPPLYWPADTQPTTQETPKRGTQATVCPPKQGSPPVVQTQPSITEQPIIYKMVKTIPPASHRPTKEQHTKRTTTPKMYTTTTQPPIHWYPKTPFEHDPSTKLVNNVQPDQGNNTDRSRKNNEEQKATLVAVPRLPIDIPPPATKDPSTTLANDSQTDKANNTEQSMQKYEEQTAALVAVPMPTAEIPLPTITDPFKGIKLKWSSRPTKVFIKHPWGNVRGITKADGFGYLKFGNLVKKIPLEM